MNESNTYYIAIVISLLVLLSLSTFFSSCEMAFSTLNRIKLKNMAVKSKRALFVLKMLETYDKILSTVLIGNNIVNIAASALAAALFIDLFGPKGVSLATLIMTMLVLVIGDISPKALAKETPELTALRNAPLLRFFVYLLSPINVIMTGWKILLMKVFPVKGDRATTEDELLTFVGEVRQEGAINIHEEHMIRQVIEFDDLRVYEIFTPRVDVVAISEESTIEEIDKKFISTGFSRLPVYRDNIDNITGIILLKDFYHKVMKGLNTPAQVVKPVVFITKTIKIGKLLKTMQEKKTHIAVVVDEHGGTLGIVTIEDIVEELVGEIWDEHDKVVESVKKNSDGSFTVLGGVNFKDMLDAVAVNADAEEIPGTTVANWIMENLGRLPKVNEDLTWKNLTIRVLKVIKQRVMEVRVTVGGNL
ncbi:MAG: hemolysin family protein [Treponema sp.]|nr:hemolysin family protein [Treponema sp.]